MRWLLPIILLIGCGGGESYEEERVVETKKAYTGMSCYPCMSDNFQGEPCDKWLDIQRIPDAVASSVLWNSFGNNPSCIYRFFNESIDRDADFAFQTQLSNEVGRKNRRLGPSDLFPELNIAQYNALLEMMPPNARAKIQSLVLDILAFLQPYRGKGRFILSTGLEEQFTPKAQNNIIEAIKEVWPYEIATYSDIYPNTLIELHGYGTSQRNAIQNGDGIDIDFSPLGRSGVSFFGQPPASMSHVMDWLRECRANRNICLLWEREHQGVEVGKFIPTLERTNFKIDPLAVPVLKNILQQP